MSQRIWIVAAVRNEEWMLPYFLRHYEPFADRIIIYDDDSTDATREIAAAHPLVDLRRLDNPINLLNDESINNAHMATLREARGHADWVMCVDCDELIWSVKDMRSVLGQFRDAGRRILQPAGYQMVSHEIPTTTGQLWQQCKMGIFSGLYSKPVVLDPELEVGWGTGRHILHHVEPKVTPSYTKRLRLLHYAAFSPEWWLQRAEEKLTRYNYTPRKRHAYIQRTMERFSAPLKQIVP